MLLKQLYVRTIKELKNKFKQYCMYRYVYVAVWSLVALWDSNYSKWDLFNTVSLHHKINNDYTWYNICSAWFVDTPVLEYQLVEHEQQIIKFVALFI